MAVAAAAACLACSGAAVATALPDIAERCRELASHVLPAEAMVASESIAAGPFAAPAGPSLAVPAFCRVHGELRPTHASRIGFELWLPASGWNGRYYQLGTGGFAGSIPYDLLLAELKRGNAAATTDTGHRADAFDASWAGGHPDRVVDYGYRSVQATAVAAQALVRAFYRTSAHYRYFAGCSNGGRQALMAAQRYPQLWDGILAGAPAYDWTRQLATFAWIQHTLRTTAASWIGPQKLPAIQRAALASCTAAAGVLDGVPADPRFCRFEPRTLLCQGAERDDCLTAAQVRSLETIQKGPQEAAGRALYFGFEPTAAAVPDNWSRWIVTADTRAQSQLTFAEAFYRHLVFGDAAWQLEDFRVPGDFARADEKGLAGHSLAQVLDARDTNLGAFEHRGGKLLMYAGWADAVVAPRAVLAYYESVSRRSGGLVQTQRFFRLFMVPGMTHCQGGPAPDAFGQSALSPGLSDDPEHDVRRALERWVEHGDAPERVVAVKQGARHVRPGPEATQLLCPFPKRAQIATPGELHSASSYACNDP